MTRMFILLYQEVLHHLPLGEIKELWSDSWSIGFKDWYQFRIVYSIHLCGEGFCFIYHVTYLYLNRYPSMISYEVPIRMFSHTSTCLWRANYTYSVQIFPKIPRSWNSQLESTLISTLLGRSKLLDWILQMVQFWGLQLHLGWCVCQGKSYLSKVEQDILLQ